MLTKTIDNYYIKFLFLKSFKEIILLYKYIVLMDRNIKVSEIIAALESNGFKKLKNKKNGHGDVYAHPDGKRTTISKHSKNGTLPIKTLSVIQKQSGLKL